ncbi:Uncharacterised protein [Vibrio cholerae]|nr:Uncharacterised protein [Vibrio cholerae]
MTEKCLPTSRKKSIRLILPIQSALLTVISDAQFSLCETINCVICWLKSLTHCCTVCALLSTRSLALKLGSPIMPVAPPISAIA